MSAWKNMINARFKHQIGGRIPHILKRKKGVTLVELMVTFALIGLFVVGTTQMIGVSIKTYHKIRSINNAKQVSDTLMDKITGEIEGAKDWKIRTGSGGDSMMDMKDKTGSPVCITTTDNRNEIEPGAGQNLNESEQINGLLIYYYEVGLFKAVGWTFDDAVYMGFEIDSLLITEAGEGYGGDIVKVELKLASAQYGSYKTTRYIQSNDDKQE